MKNSHQNRTLKTPLKPSQTKLAALEAPKAETLDTHDSRLKRKITNLVALYSILIVLPKVGSNKISSWIPLLDTEYWSYFVGFSAFYQCLSLATESLITHNSEWVMRNLSVKAKEAYPTAHDFGLASTTQFTGLVHAIISSLGSLWLTLTPSVIHHDHFFGSTFLSSLHCVHSSALFFTELMDLLQQPEAFSTTYGRVILLHHTLAMLAFGTGGYGVGNYYISVILLAELSSIFLGLRWFLLQLDFASTPLFKVVENLFVALFVGVRIGFGYLYVTPNFVGDLIPLAMGGSVDVARFPLFKGQVSLGTMQTVARVAVVLVSAYHAMNAFFLYQIIRMALKSADRAQDAKSPDSKTINEESQKRILSSMPHE